VPAQVGPRYKWIAPVASSTPPALPAGVIEAEAEVSAEAVGRPRVTVAEEIEDTERRLASPELATRYRKER
jgi:hypothetical protein